MTEAKNDVRDRHRCDTIPARETPLIKSSPDPAEVNLMFYILALYFGAILLGFAWKASATGSMYVRRGRYVTFTGEPLEFGFQFLLSVALGAFLCLFGLLPI